MLLNMTGPYYPTCDLVKLHQDDLENLLSIACAQNSREDLIGNDYLVTGTVDESLFQISTARQDRIDLLVAHLHGFEKYVTFDQSGWARNPAVGKRRKQDQRIMSGSEMEIRQWLLQRPILYLMK